MNEFQPHPANNLEFDEREQAEIIALAAALQREHGQRATLSELERAAIEAGIEPRFVREAVQRRRQGLGSPIVIAASETPPEWAWHVPLAALLFIPVQSVVFHLVVQAYRLGRQPMLLTLIALAVGVAFGLSLPRRPSVRWVAAFMPAFVVIFVSFCGVLFPSETLLIRVQNHESWFPFIGLALFQGVVAVAAHVIRERNEESPALARP